MALSGKFYYTNVLIWGETIHPVPSKTPAAPLLPAKEVTLIHFVSHLAEYVRFHTIKVYLAAIQN